MKITAAILFLLLLFVSAVAIAVVPEDTHTHKAPAGETDLAARINSACKRGYAVNDWTTGDEFDPVPEGTVKVTCARKTEPYDLYYVAVAR